MIDKRDSPTPTPYELQAYIDRIGTEPKPDDPDKSYLFNCWVGMRPGDCQPVKINHETHAFSVHLDGYAIIPLEEYASLLRCSAH